MQKLKTEITKILKKSEMVVNPLKGYIKDCKKNKFEKTVLIVHGSHNGFEGIYEVGINAGDEVMLAGKFGASWEKLDPLVPVELTAIKTGIFNNNDIFSLIMKA